MSVRAKNMVENGWKMKNISFCDIARRNIKALCIFKKQSEFRIPVYPAFYSESHTINTYFRLRSRKKKKRMLSFGVRNMMMSSPHADGMFFMCHMK